MNPSLPAPTKRTARRTGRPLFPKLPKATVMNVESSALFQARSGPVSVPVASLARSLRAWPVALGLALALAACGDKGTGGEHKAGSEAAKSGAAPAGAPLAARDAAAKGPKPALTVSIERPRAMTLGRSLSANGVMAPWQEASIGAEVGGLKLTAVNVNVGDTVRKGQVLATLSPTAVQIDMMNLKAQIAEAEATLADARANAERARQLDQTGAISAQQIAQFVTAEKTAQARLEAARARLQSEELRLANTRILASDAGVISARTATLGAVVQPGQELFRMIRQGRLEWRGEVTGAELPRIRIGQAVALEAPDGSAVRGKVRMLAPVVDAQTRNALVYVDVPSGSSLKAGMLVKGAFDLGQGQALTVPQSALLRRDGFSYLYLLEGADRVRLVKVETGQRSGDRIEISKGLAPEAGFVRSGVGFLNDGDLVRVVDTPAKP